MERPKVTKCQVCGKQLDVQARGAVPVTCGGKCRDVFRESRDTGRGIVDVLSEFAVKAEEHARLSREAANWYAMQARLRAWADRREAVTP